MSTPECQSCNCGFSTASHTSSSRCSSLAISSVTICRNSATASSEPDWACAERLQPAWPVVQVAQLRRPAEQVQGQRQVGVGPGAARPTLVGGGKGVAQERPAADQPGAADRAALEPRDDGLGIVGQPPAELRRRDLLILVPVGEPGGIHPGIVLEDPHSELVAPPGAQRHLADQLALDLVSRLEVAGEAGLAALDLRRRGRRQDDSRAGEPVLAAIAAAAALAFRRGWPAREPAVGPAGVGPRGASVG